LAFEVFLHPNAVKALKKIDSVYYARIKKALEELEDEPERAGKALRYSDFFSLRVGDYRVIYKINKAKCQVVVLLVGHRKNVYDDFTKLF
jgi:mRNA interferase RelE/StbE